MKPRFTSLIITAMLALAGTASALMEAPTLDEAKAIAKAENRTILLELTGKDWCPGCIYLKGKILDSDVLEKAVGKDYILVELDYPRDPKKIAAIPEEERKAREDIIVTFKVRGLPCVIYMDAEGLPFAVVSAYTQTPEQYLTDIMAKAQEVRAARDAALTRAAGLQGMEKARALVAALELLPETCRGQYKAVLAEIDTLDPDNTLGYSHLEASARRRLEQIRTWDAHAKAYIKALPGAPTDPANVASVINMCEEYLQQDDLLTEVQQRVLILLSESYALQRNVPMVYATMVRAVQLDPESEVAQGLKGAIKYYDDFLLKELNQEEAAHQAAAPYLPANETAK